MTVFRISVNITNLHVFLWIHSPQQLYHQALLASLLSLVDKIPLVNHCPHPSPAHKLLTIHSSTVLSSHKCAVIRPCIKVSGLDLSDPAEYHHISNLSFIPKLIACAVHWQLSCWI